MRIPTFLLIVLLCVIPCTLTIDQEGDVRLVGGATPYEGRVEVFTLGRWGTVCGRGFGTPDGQVVCHQLGYGDVAMGWRPVSVMYGAYFGENRNVTIHVADLFCKGVEDKLVMCGGNWGDDFDCGHSQDVGVICSFGNETEGDIRLVGAGVGIETEGRIQILRHNSWGTICHHSWDLQDANVACRQQGFEFALLSRRNSFYGGGNLDQPVMLSNVECDGTEEHLLDCPNDGWGVEDCDFHQEDVGVVCSEETLEGTMRLSNSAVDNEGVLEIYHGGEWGTICNDDSWSDNEALVACRHLGYDMVTSYDTPTAPSSAVIQLDAVSCYGYELTLANCRHGEWGNASVSCTHDTDVWLSCDHKPVEEGDVRLVGGYTPSQGRVEFYRSGTWTTICETSSAGDLQKATVICRQLGYLSASEAFGRAYFGAGSEVQPVEVVECHGFEKGLADCVRIDETCDDHERDAGVICTDHAEEGHLRLVNGSDYTEGRLEIFHGGEWGSVCNTSWLGDDASVACSQMGLGNVRYAYLDYGPGQGPVHLDDVDCSGLEGNLKSCQSADWGVNECGHESDVGMSCFLYKEPDNGDVRLTGGSSFMGGRVETYQSPLGQQGWWSVCRGSSWDINNAQVICNGLEMDVHLEDEDFGPGGHPGVLEVDCVGTESRLEFCYIEFTGTECGSEDRVGVICKNNAESPMEGDIRLREGESFNEGRVEIFHAGVWGFICRNDWGRSEASVACRQLGYEHVRATSVGTNYADRPVHLGFISCDGDEESLLDCYRGEWGDASCSLSYCASVACSATEVEEPLEGWAIALIVIFSIMVMGAAASITGYLLWNRKRNRPT